MRVWLLIDARGIGGIETHVCHLARALSEHGMEAEVVLLCDHGQSPFVMRLVQERLPFRVLSHWRRLLPLLLGDRVDLLHTHGYKAGILGRLLGALGGVPVVSTFHSGDDGRGRLAFYSRLDRWTAPLAKCIAVSGEIAAKLNGKAHLIPNFVPLPSERSSLMGRRIAFVGRLSEEKDPALFCQLAGLCPEGEFHLYGEGPLHSRLVRQYADRVQFHGFCEMAAHWKEIDLLCITSTHEGLPLAALEAMAHGIPLCSFAVGGIPSLIDHRRNGWLIPPGDRLAMAAQLNYWLSLSAAERLQMGNRARHTVVAGYSVESRMSEILAVYLG